MKPPRAIARRLLFLSTIIVPVRAGIMDPEIGVQTYRDFAENRGVFQPGATNVQIFNLSGSLVGTVPVMPDFDSTVDGGWSALIGGPSFIATVAHNNATTVSFTGRFGGGSSTPFHDSYSFINYNRMPNGYDFAAPRLNKIVTEVEAGDYFLLANYNGPETSYPDAAGALYAVRAGGGTQVYATGTGSESGIEGAYSFLTGGTVKFTSNYQSVSSPDGFGYIYWNWPADAAQPLDIGIRAGDSGSPAWLYNPTTSRYEYIGAGQSGGGSGYNALNQMRGGNEWAVANIAAYNSTITDAGGAPVTWNADATGTGNFVQNGNVIGTYVGLPDTVRGATSATAANGSGTTYASNTQLDATRNLVFAGGGAAVTLGAPLDLGAGSMTFLADYTLGGARLNSAGMIVGSGVTLTSQLTGLAGDEWRKTGAGTLVIGGTGDNPAKLNTGGGGLTVLDRTDGHAVSQVKINGDRNTTVRLTRANQIAGANGSASTVVFGHRGGTLDLHGHNAAWSGITHLDRDANIANTLDGSVSTFTFTGPGAQTYLGRFSDGGSPADGLLNVVYAGGTGSSWALKGEISHHGSWNIASGETRIVGTPTPRAGGFVDPSDWQRAAFQTGTVSVADGARFTIDEHADVASDFSVDGTGALWLTGTDNTFTGDAAFNAPTARFRVDTPAGATAQVTGALTGSGFAEKSGPGMLRLENPSNTLAGASVIQSGTVSAATLGALGTGPANWTTQPAGVLSVDNATAAAVKASLAAGSHGTLALATTAGNPDDAPDMSGAGYADLFLGALGEVAIGNDPTTTATLGEWSGGGWKLGGGGGTLTVNLRLAGSGGLTIGNGHNSGVVILANTGNEQTFSGAITIATGVDLRYTDIRALGGGLLDVGYGSSVTSLTSGGSSLLGRISQPSAGVVAIENGADNSSVFDFAAAGLHSIHLGAEGAGTWSGILTPGNNGYRFGGAGHLTVTTALTGNHAVTVDGHNMTGGMVTLAGSNSFTGPLTVRGYDSGIITPGGGAITLRAGSATAFGASAPVLLRDGGTLDLDGHFVTIGSLDGAPGSAIINSSVTADATLVVQQSADATLYSGFSSPGGRNLNLVKNGAATLTLAGPASHTGIHTVAGGVLRLGAAGAFGGSASQVQVQPGGSFDVNGITPAATAGISLAGTGAGDIGALHNSVAGSGVNLGQVSLAADATIGGASNTTYTISNLNPAGHTATIQTSRLNLNNGSHTGTGHLVATNGVLIYGSNTITGDPGTLTLHAGSSLDLRDFSNPNDAKTIILNGGRIGNGYTHNGGGGQTTISNPLHVTAASTLDGNNGGWNYRLQIAGPLSGSAPLSLAGSRGVRFMGDTSAYTGTATIASGSGVAFSGTSDQVFNGTLAGSNKLYKEGSAGLLLTAANTYSAGTELLGGALAVNSLSGIGGGYLAVKNGATFVYNGSGAETTTRILWLDLGAGVIAVPNPSAHLTWNPSGGTRSTPFTKTGAGELTLGGAFSGAASITVNAGTLRLRATNSHSGATTVAGGTLALDYTANNTSKLADSGGLVLAGGTLALNGGSHTEAVASTTLAAGTASALTRSSGTAVLALGSITREPGGTLDVGGTLLATTTAPLVNGLLPGVTLNGGLATRDGADFVVAYSGFSDLTRLSSGSKVIANDGALNSRILEGTGIAGNITLAAPLTDTHTLTNSSTGGTATVELGGNTLRLGAIGHLIAESGSQGLVVGGGSLTAGGAPGSAGELIVLNHSPAPVVLGAGIADNGAGIVSLAKQGPGALVLAGPNSHSGATSVAAGTLALGAANVIPDGTGKGSVSVAAAATFDLGGFDETVNGMQSAGVIDNSGAGAATLTIGATGADGAISGIIRNTGGALALAKTGGGILTLSGANTFGGAVSVTGGTLVLAGGSAIPDGSPLSLSNTSGVQLILQAPETTGSLSGGGNSGGGINLGAHTLTLNHAATTTYGGVISGSGGTLVKTGTGTLTLSNNASAFTGGLRVEGGTLATGTAAGGGTNGYLGAVSGSRTITVAAGATMNWLANNQFGGSGKTAAGIPRVVIDGGTVHASRFNIIGHATLDNGAILRQASTDSGAYDGYEFIGGTITVGGSGASTISTSNNSANHLAGGRTTTFEVAETTGDANPDLIVSAPLRDGSGDYSGAGSLRKTGAGVMRATAVNSFTGTLTVAGGTFEAAVDSPSGNASAIGGGANPVVVENGATLLFSGVTRSSGFHSGPANLHGGGIRFQTPDNNFASGNTVTFDTAPGTIDGSGQWRRRNADNKVVVTAAASGSSIAVADLNLFDNTPLFEVADGALAHDLTISSVITGSAGIGLAKTGAGSLRLTASNSYSGPTFVNGGRLTVNGSLAAGPVTVAANAILSGTGAIGGAVGITGTLDPGDAGIGTLTLNQTLTLNGAAVMEIHKDGSTLASDRVAGMTTLACGGKLEVIASGDPLAAGDRFVLFSAAAISGTFSEIILPELAGGLVWNDAELLTTGTLSVLSPLQAWRQTHFETPENAGIAANDTDPDGDGIANLIEYALGLNPHQPQSLATRVVMDTASGHLRLSITRNPAASDVVLGVEVSADLETWRSGEGVDVITEENTPGSLVVRDLTAVHGAFQRFIRLRATAVP